jgi:NAD(P)-dependent dehydrogenase (short-subunit alcohol dehydrogenase family)
VSRCHTLTLLLLLLLLLLLVLLQAPGYIVTEINREFFSTPRGDKVIAKIPQGRVGQPADLDGILLLMASGAGSFMTGSVVNVDGGHLVSNL